MTEPIPLLQIIHVSDTHVQKGRGDKVPLAGNELRFRLWFREQLEKRNVGEWHEGTLGHDDTAVLAFERFLRDARVNDKDWFPDGAEGPETWLIDTGDASTSGDRDSLAAAHAMLDKWAAILKPCKVRSLYGNHDAWPGTHPAVLAGNLYHSKMAEQRTLLQQRAGWDPAGWLEPLSTVAVGGRPRIECYGINTVRFSWMDNVLAVGRIDDDELLQLKGKIIQQGEHPTYRILLTHHPITFPYERSDRKVALLLSKMALENADAVAKQLINEAPVASLATRTPYIHLMLSGHTHLGMPGQRLPENGMEVHQPRLGRTQIQLVTGALMQLRSQKAVRNDVGPQATLKDRKDFSHPFVFDANQQFQILRFYFDEEYPDGLWLERLVMARSSNNKRGYASVPELTSTTFVSYGNQL